MIFAAESNYCGLFLSHRNPPALSVQWEILNLETLSETSPLEIFTYY